VDDRAGAAIEDQEMRAMTPDETRAGIAVVGSTMIDLVAFTERVPSAGETLVGRRFQMGFGGKGANQAVMASLLGADVAMVNCLGDDAYGDMTLENFATFGIDTTHVHRTEGASGVAPIWVEGDGTNRIIIIPGANDALMPDQAADAVMSMPDVSVVLGQLEIPQVVTTSGFQAAREQGATTILNPAPAAELGRGLLAASTWLIPNEFEFCLIAGTGATDDDALSAFSVATDVRLIVTLGEGGVALVNRDGSVTRLPAQQREAVDTTGAGDAFVGAFSYGLAAGMGEIAAINLGIACAGDSVTKPGTQTSYPDKGACTRILASIADE
jgi:ribokinase